MMHLFKRYQNSVLVENEKEAMIVAREEGLPDVNPDAEYYPVDILLPQKRTLKGALKRCIELSKMGLYSMIIRRKK